MARKYTTVPNEPLDDFSDLDSLDNEIELLDYQEEEPFQLDQLNKSTLKMAFMNMANSILGAGAIGTPFAMRNCGVLGGAVALVLLTILVDFTLRLIVINLKLSGKSTYQDTVEHCFGKMGKLIIIFTQALFAFGGSIGFCIIIGDTLPHILRSFFPSYQESSFLSFIFGRNFIIILVTMTISYPLSLSRDISKLAKASALALVSMAVIILIVLFRGPQLAPEWRGSLSTGSFFLTSRIFQGISVISFALVCHHNTSFIFHSLRTPSLNRFAQVTHASCFVSMIALALIGFGGFLIFRDKTKGNILNNFPSDDPIVNIARFCFGFNMLTTYPLEIFVLRDVLRDLYFINHDSSPELSTKKHVIFTTVLVIITMGISLTTCNLGALFELIGATTASIMAYILPPMCNLAMTNQSKTIFKKIPYYATIAFGFATMIISSTQTILNAIHGDDTSHCVI
jgi:sodium-coupled neutral amino acid transporter 11